MAHELYDNDTMFSVREKPWHGLGEVLEDYPTLEDAKKKSGLNWDAYAADMFADANGDGEMVSIPDRFAIIRDDTKDVVGVVGKTYEIFQNSEMWDFISWFQDQSGCKLETAGSLRNGQTTWVLAKNGTTEYVSGDPVEEYFLFRNSFNGRSPIMCMFTNVRVVCNNTLTAAIQRANNVYTVRHTSQADQRLKQVEEALAVRMNYQTQFNEAMQELARKQVTEQMAKDYLDKLFAVPKFIGEEDVGKRGKVRRENQAYAVLSLYESGAGTDIPGVKGTAYGLYNAVAEYADHFKTVKTSENRSEEEGRFENAMWGTAADLKAKCFKDLVKV